MQMKKTFHTSLNKQELNRILKERAENPQKYAMEPGGMPIRIKNREEFWIDYHGGPDWKLLTEVEGEISVERKLSLYDWFYIVAILSIDLLVVLCFCLVGFTVSVAVFLLVFTLGGGLFIYGINVKMPLMCIDKFIKKYLGGK